MSDIGAIITGTPSISATVELVGGSGGGSGLEWVVSTSSPLNAIANRAYAIDSLALTLINLPPSPVNGQKLAFYAVGTGNWRVQQIAGQRIRIGNMLTTLGVQGAVMSHAQGDYLELVYIAPNWVCTEIIGNLEVF